MMTLHRIRKAWILLKRVIGSIGMIPTMPTIMLMRITPLSYHVIILLNMPFKIRMLQKMNKANVHLYDYE